MNLFLPRTLCRPSFVARKLNVTRARPFSTTPIAREVRYIRFQSPTPGGGPGKGPQRREVAVEVAPIVKLAALVGGGGAIYYVSHLEKVPDTGRWRFMNTSPGTEAQMGQIVSFDIHASAGNLILPPTHPVTRHVRRVVSRILTASNLGVIQGERQPERSLLGLGNVFGGFGGFSSPDSDFGAATQPNESYGPEKEWEVIVVNDRKIVNAMAAPGVVVVYTGILPVCRDEEGLAAVLAHEIGHIVARHTAERLSSQSVLMGVVFLLRILGVDYFLSRGLSTYLLELPNSRTQEREADLVGLRLMSRACYDPKAAPAMFNRLGQLEESIAGKGFEFIQTHPTSENRAKYLEKFLPEAYRILEDNPECVEVRRQMDAFKETARGITIDEKGTIEYR